MLPDKDELDREEERLRKEIAGLPQEQKVEFYRDLEKETRDPDNYAVLAWLAFAGLQHFYLGNWLKGAGVCSLFLVAVALYFTEEWLWGVGLFLLIVLAEVYYLFGSQRIVKDYNNQATARILERYKNPSPGRPKETGW